jgi:galactonate dehydratase
VTEDRTGGEQGRKGGDVVKITAVKGFPVKVGHRNQWLVKVETDAGISGVGEGGISGRELAMQGMLEHYARFLVGEDPFRIEHLWQTMYRSAYFEGGKIAGAVISAVDIALWDILGKALGVPGLPTARRRLSRADPLLRHPRTVDERGGGRAGGGPRRARGGATCASRPAWTSPGWDGATGSVFEPFESLELAAVWLRKVREAVGPKVELSIDFHHRLSVAEAALFCQRVADLNLMFIEEPIRAESPAAYRQLRTMTPIPFAIGEEFSSKWAFAPFIEEGLLNYARIDVSNVGGLSEAKKVAGWCETRYVDVMPHNPLGPVTTAATIHLAAAINNFAQLEYQHRLAEAYPADLFPKMPILSGDVFPLPTEPGLGVEFDEAAVANHAFEPWEAPHWRRRDGAYTNW